VEFMLILLTHSDMKSNQNLMGDPPERPARIQHKGTKAPRDPADPTTTNADATADLFVPVC